MTDDDAETILDEAKATVGSRDGTHGDPVENHEHIAAMWTAFFDPKLEDDAEITAAEVAQAMVHVKQSRAMVGGATRDHFVDIAGYAHIAHECEEAASSDLYGDFDISNVRLSLGSGGPEVDDA